MMGERPRRPTKALRSVGIVVMLTNSANIKAPIRIRNSIAVVRALSRSAAQRVFNVSAPRSSRDRKSTRLNSSHVRISYAAFCFKKKKGQKKERLTDRTGVGRVP